jgi:hypothetical protein
METALLGLRILLALLLYAFLAIVVAILWLELRQTASLRQPVRPVIQLVVLESVDENLAEGAVFPLQPITSIGRSTDNAITVADSYASGHHALLAWRESQWWLRDQNSRNGTLLNGHPITAPTVVSAGDVIHVGRTRFKLELA